MNKIILFLTLFISINIYCQNFEQIKKLDTIYINFKGNKYEKKTVFPEEKGQNLRWYMFFCQKNREKSKGLNFNYLDIKIDGFSKSNGMNDVKIVNKSFLKKNKNKIIGMKFFEKYDICDIGFEILTSNKIFYIIDCTEKKDGEITLYQVKPWKPCVRGE